MIRLIACDLDDTLLDDDLTISTQNKKAVGKALAQGIVFTIATGRMFVATVPYALQLGLPPDQPLICYNGALIKKLSGETIYERPLPVGLAAAVAEYGQNRMWTVNAYYNDQLWVARSDERIEEYAKFTGVGVQEVGDLAAFIKSGQRRLSKILVISDPQETPPRIRELRRLFGSKAQIVQSKKKFVEITSPTAHKGQALLWLAQYLGLERQEVMAIGDSSNDITMLQMAGLGVAVANAAEEAKKAAQYVTAASSEHGVARAIQEHVLDLSDAV